ncbi:Mor transcription activator family protein [Terasakiispira papahanaumokuakeensis]|nr:Mor transcription activator family protein [Terasakiispira papahanaumokuakeensis]
MKSAMAELRHELLIDVAGHVADVMRDHKVDEDLAEQVGYAVADRLAANWGGQTISFPKDSAFKLAKRDRMIYAEWGQLSPPQLARKYNLTVQAIYSILRRAKKAAISERQDDMFGFDDR